MSNAGRAQAQVGKTALLYFYDWEPNVIGPDGKPAPSESTVTGGEQAASSEAGLLEYQAVLRAAKRPAIIRKNDTTLSPGCTPEQKEGCIYGTWYLLDTKHEKVLRGPEETEANLYSEGFKAPAGAKLKAVRVNPGTVLVQARPVEGADGKVTQASPNSWYVLNDDPVLEGSDITNPQESSESESGQPDVTFGFNSHGKSVFQKVTKEIAQRGQEAQLPGVSKEAAQQHFAIVLDGQVITAPSIDYTKYPEGIDASTGSEISGGFTLTSARKPRGRAAVRRAADQAEPDLPVAGVGDARQTGAQPGSVGDGLLGFAVVCLFLLIFYRVLGAIAIGGLVIYGIYYFALIKLIPITLTLPGIAGLILTIGIAADANIVIFERVKEEIRGGRSIVSGIATGYRRGFAAIVDANVVTFMTAFILFALATAEVKGFAFTLGIGTLAVAVHRGARHAGGTRRDEPLAAGLPSGGARRGAARERLDVRLHGRLEVVLLAVGHDPLDRGAGDRREGDQLRNRLQVRDADPDGVHQVRQREPDPRSDEGQRLRQRGDPEVHEQERRRHRLSDLDRDAAARKGDEDQGRPRHQVRKRPARTRHQGLLLDLDRADVRQNGRQQRGDRDHRLAARDLRIHRAALRVEVRGPSADRVDARPVDHGGRLCADRPRSDDGDGRGVVDHPRVFAVRHDHRVRSCARERAADATRGVLADRQPLDVRGADQIAGDELLHAACR